MRAKNVEGFEKTKSLIAKGYKVNEIAEKVGVTSNTIRTWKRLIDDMDTTEEITSYDEPNEKTEAPTTFDTMETENSLYANLETLIKSQEARLTALKAAQSLICPK